jgi:Caspase domain
LNKFNFFWKIIFCYLKSWLKFGLTSLIFLPINFPLNTMEAKEIINLPPVIKPTLIAQNERRVALVIGNSQYKTSPLTNPVNDASDMSTVLK